MNAKEPKIVTNEPSDIMKAEPDKTAKIEHPRSQDQHRRLPAALLCLIALLLLFGSILSYAKAPLALEEFQTGEDRLAGVFITENYIEPGMPHIDVNASGEIVIKEQEPNRIYGTLYEGSDAYQSPITFPELEGYGIYNLQLWNGETQFSRYYTCDDIFMDLLFTVTDDEEHAEASLYVRTDIPRRYYHYYFNPVYQQADGQLYLLPGTGISMDSFTDGMAFTQSLAQSTSESINGTEMKEGYRFTVKIVAADAPGDMKLIFMDQENQILQSLSDEELESLFQQGSSQLEIPANASYLILRQTKSKTSEYTHTLFDRGTETLEYMVAAEDGYLHPRCLTLIWNQ